MKNLTLLKQQFTVYISLDNNYPSIEVTNDLTKDIVFFAQQDDVQGILTLLDATPNLTRHEALLLFLEATNIITATIKPDHKLRLMVEDLDTFIQSQYEAITTRLFEACNDVECIYTDYDTNIVMVQTNEDSYALSSLKYEDDERFKELIQWHNEMIETFGAESNFCSIDFEKTF